MSYALATYAVVLLGFAAYGAWLARARRRLEQQLQNAPDRNGG